MYVYLKHCLKKIAFEISKSNNTLKRVDQIKIGLSRFRGCWPLTSWISGCLFVSVVLLLLFL